MQNVSHDFLNYNNLVNVQSSLNQFKIGWWLGVPNTSGGLFFYDLMETSHGSLQNVSSANGWKPSFRTGSFTSISLNGNGDYVAVTDHAKLKLGTSDFSVSGWFKLNTLNNVNANGKQFIVSRYESANSKGFSIGVNTSGSIIFELNVNNTTFSSFASGTAAVAINTWYHFLAVRQNIYVYLYLNGRLVASGTTPTTYNISSATTQDLLLGDRVDSTGAHYYCSGFFDDICIYEAALSSASGWRLYNESRLGYPTTLNRMSVGRAFAISSPWIYFSMLQNAYGVTI